MLDASIASRVQWSTLTCCTRPLRHLHDTFGRRDGLCMRATADFRKKCMFHALNSWKLRKNKKSFAGGVGSRTWGREKKLRNFENFLKRKKSKMSIFINSRKNPTQNCRQMRTPAAKAESADGNQCQRGGGQNPGRPAGWAAANPARTRARTHARKCRKSALFN